MVCNKIISEHSDVIKKTSKKLMKLIEKYENSNIDDISINELDLREFISDIQLKEVLNGFAQNKNLVVLESIAKNKYTPAEKLKELAKYHISSVEKNVALNPSTPAKTLEMISTGYGEYVILNPSTPAEIVKRIITKNKKYDECIALYENTSVETHEKDRNNNKNKKLLRKLSYIKLQENVLKHFLRSIKIHLINK